ncbi:diguanylate cyclase [Parasalinivibrio latis]|uniref:sensor domain-containing diguanylate cyclase n=1 Tax=Parasalinivibrio latis TaxID=2952610 RepID=UPI0030E42D21
MKLASLTLRTLSFVYSAFLVGLFLLCYLVFYNFLVHNPEIELAKKMQKQEVERVENVFKLYSSQMTSTVLDYGHWDSMKQFVKEPTQEFIEDNLSDYTFESLELDAFFIYNEKSEVVWHYNKDLETGKPLDVSDLLSKDFNFEQYTSQLDDEAFGTLTLANNTYLYAIAGICDSNGEECGNSHLLTLRKLRLSLEKEINGLTGLEVRLFDDDHVNFPKIHEHENVTHLILKSVGNQPTLNIEITHSTKIPEFLCLEELMGLVIICIVVFALNFALVGLIIAPLQTATFELRNYMLSGDSTPFMRNFRSFELQYFARTVRDLIENLHNQKKQLLYLSEHDPLTGLGNRRKLEQELENILYGSSDLGMGIFLIDIDHFKAFNDNYGHTKGDKVLSLVAETLAIVSRKNGGFAARFGGEEFCIVVPVKPGDDFEPGQFANLICKRVEQCRYPHIYSATSDVITVSVGGLYIPRIASYHRDKSLISLFNLADLELYRAKDSGRNTFKISEGDETVSNKVTI